MAGQGNLFLDIDHEPERQSARPSGMGSANQSNSNPLWPAQTTPPQRSAPVEIGEAPLGSVPLPAGAGDTIPGRAAGHISQELAASLAALGASATKSHPISLAAALAAIRTEDAPDRQGNNATHPIPADWDANATNPILSTAAGTMPALQSPTAADAQTTPLWTTAAHALDDDWPLAGGIQRVHAAPLEETSASDDAYLDRVYDFTRPEIAKLYDRTVVPLWSTPFGRMLLTAFLSSPRQPGWQVVDVACGTGYPTLELAQLLGPDGDIAGLDLWEAGIERARRKAEALRVNNVAFLVSDIARCELPERSFDAAICNLGLTNFVRPEAALQGIARLLQPNGTLILTTNLQGTMLEFFELYQAVLNDLGLVDMSQGVERMLRMQPTIEAVETLLERVGFTVDQTISDHFALEFPDGSTFLRSPLVGMGFLKSWRNLVSDLALRQVIFNEIERRLNTRAAAWGRLDLTVPMLCLTARRRAEEE
jgi:arsenite methyltransferase